jgi:hypothetical protein
LTRPDRSLVRDYVETTFGGLPSSNCASGSAVLIDTFRRLHPTRPRPFTCWNTQLALRARNEGGRIDFVLADRRLADSCLVHAEVRQEVVGSDHCPVEAAFGSCDLVPSPAVPRFAAKYYRQFEHKQQKLTSFFVKGGPKRPNDAGNLT